MPTFLRFSPYILYEYAVHSCLLFCEHEILSQSGYIRSILLALSSFFHNFYRDNGVLLGPMEQVSSFSHHFESLSPAFGLPINLSMCATYQAHPSKINGYPPGERTEFLGSPSGSNRFDHAFEDSLLQ